MRWNCLRNDIGMDSTNTLFPDPQTTIIWSVLVYIYELAITCYLHENINIYVHL